MAYPQPQRDPTAVLGRRTLAALLDALLLFIPFVMLLTASFEYIEEADLPIADGQEFCDQLDDQDYACIDFTDVDDRVYFADDFDNGAWIALWGGSFAVYVLLQAFTGWTPGKLVTGVRVVREDGRRPGFVKTLVRWLLWLVDGFPYLIPGLVGFILGLTTPGHRRLGDMAAKTFVVRTADAGSPIAAPGVTTTAAAAAPSAPWGAPTTGVGAPPPTTGWGAEPEPSTPGWASPTPTTPPAAAPPPAPAPSDGPQWDEARGTYIQWDPNQRAWMQWDEGFKAWSRIPGQ